MTQASSSTSSFRKVIKNIAGIVAWLVIIVLLVGLLRRALMDDVDSQSRIMLHEFYDQQSMDILFIGSSHSYRSIDPDLADGYFGAHTFNAGTSLQQMDGTYTLIKEARKYYDLKEVYLDIYYLNMASAAKEDRMDMTSTYIVSDYMRPSLNRTRYLLFASKDDHWINSFILPRRNWRKLLDPGYLRDLRVRKSADSYKNYDYVGTDNEYYCGRGYVASTDVATEGSFDGDPGAAVVTDGYITPDNAKDLRKILKYCRKNGIKITLFSAPMPDQTISKVENYDGFIRMIRDIAGDYGVSYYDFNLCRPEYFSYDLELFADHNHLNKEGAEVFGRLFSDFFNGHIDEGDLFYGSYAEKLNNYSYFD